MTKNRIQEQKAPRGYKETKIGLIPDDWDCMRLDDMGSLSKGAGISKSEVQENGLPAVRYGELYTCYDTQINYVHSFINETSASNSKEINCGDILFAGSGETLDEIGKSAVYLGDDKAYAGGDIIIFSPKNRDSLCFAYLLNGQLVRRELRRLGQGQSIVHIYKPDISKLYLPVPPLPEQKKIADILGEWDSAILETEKLISLKKKLKKALCQQLLTGKCRFKEFKGQKWKTVTLKDFLIPTIRPIPKPSTAFMALGIRSFGNGTFQKPEFEPSGIALEELYQVKKHDLIVNITFAWEGAIAIVKESDDGALVSHRFPTYEFNKDVAIPEYFRHVILQKRFIHELSLVSPGGAGRNRVLSKTDFLKIKVTIPPLKEQYKIGTLLNSFDREIELLNQRLELLKQQKRGLMQKLLTGQIRVKGTNIA